MKGSRLLLGVLGTTLAAMLPAPASANAQTPTVPGLALSEYCPVSAGRLEYGFIAQVGGLPPNASFSLGYTAFLADGDAIGARSTFTTDAAGRYELRVATGNGRTVLFFIVTVGFAGEFVEDSLDRPCMSSEQILFGKRTVGSTFGLLDHNDKYGSRYYLFTASPVAVAKLRAYLDGLGRRNGTQLVRGLIYRHTATGPGVLVAQSAAVRIGASQPATWFDFDFPSPPRLQAGGYWLTLHAGESENVVRYAFDVKPGGQRHNDDLFSNGPLNPFGGSDRAAREMSIHAVGR